MMMMMMMIMIAGVVDSISTPIKSWLEHMTTTSVADKMTVKEVDSSGVGVDCIVCLSEVAVGDRFALLERCRHGFHVDCVEAWLKDHPNCPLCRTPVFGADRLYLKKSYDIITRYALHVMETIATCLTTSFTQGLHSSLSHSCTYL